MAQSTSTSNSSSPLSQEEKVRHAARQLMRITERKIGLYQPYQKQMAFHAMGREKHERAMLAGNQLGKTTSGAAEAVYHLTGEYPTDWKGLRFKSAIKMWAAGPTNRKTRDVVQTKLLGRRGRYGTGLIPKAAIHAEPTMSRGLSGMIDTLEVKHKGGGISTISFMSYDMDVDAWASDTLHLIWFDEEPPQPLYDEGLARLTATGGSAYITVTPLLGMTDVMSRFYPRPNTTDRGLVMMGIKDAVKTATQRGHIPEHDVERILARYPAHERTARAEGIPILGSGLVFATADDRKVHVYDSDTGQEIWQTALGGRTSASPSMYELGGRQYLLVTATPAGGRGGGRGGRGRGAGAGPPSPSGPTGLVAYALPQD